jgi:hypothetical protein
MFRAKALIWSGLPVRVSQIFYLLSFKSCHKKASITGNGFVGPEYISISTAIVVDLDLYESETPCRVRIPNWI